VAIVSFVIGLWDLEAKEGVLMILTGIDATETLNVVRDRFATAKEVC